MKGLRQKAPQVAGVGAEDETTKAKLFKLVFPFLALALVVSTMRHCAR
jgi:hypothetical protein